jgi:hypothetical protein
VPTNVQLAFARDTGHHTEGGFVSPVSERCYHLALAFIGIEEGTSGEEAVLLPADGARLSQWLLAFFGSNYDHVWVEAPRGHGFWERLALWWAGPLAAPGDMVYWHFRLFCDESWNALTENEWPREMIRDFRARGWVRASELVIGDSARRPLLPVRFFRRVFA